MKENTIVSLADSNYFELLNELIDSIKQFDQSKSIAICILTIKNEKEIKNADGILKVDKLEEKNG